jgi:hypothetical protein
MALLDTALNDPQASADLIVKREMGGLEEVGGAEGLDEWLHRSYEKYRCLCRGGTEACEECPPAEEEAA